MAWSQQQLTSHCVVDLLVLVDVRLSEVLFPLHERVHLLPLHLMHLHFVLFTLSHSFFTVFAGQ